MNIVHVLNAVEAIVRRCTKSQYLQMRLRELVYAIELRVKYSGLTLFDSIHVAVTIINNLIHYDLDPLIKNVIASKLRK